MFKPARYERNHYEIGFTTVAATELQTALLTGTDDVVNRSTSFPTGAILTRLVVRIWGTAGTPVGGKHECMILYQAGASDYATPIASWYSTTNPIAEENQQVRANNLERGVKRIVTITGASGAPRLTCFFRGKKLIHDGDDILLVNLDQNATAWAGVCDYTFIR